MDKLSDHRLRIGSSGQLDSMERNPTEKRFHTLKQRIDGFHTSWMGSSPVPTVS
jgi:putative transposase